MNNQNERISRSERPKENNSAIMDSTSVIKSCTTSKKRIIWSYSSKRECYERKLQKYVTSFSIPKI